MKKLLSELIDVYGSDKNASNYVHEYERLFDPIRDNNIKLLEIGLGTVLPNVNSTMFFWKNDRVQKYKPGASLRAWRDYFEKGMIYGGDIQEDTQFKEDRISTFLFNSQIKEECDTALYNLMFDIIIDDGDHSAYSQVTTLHNLIDRVNKGGYYIIEDIHRGNDHVVYSNIDKTLAEKKFSSYFVNDARNLLICKNNS